MINPFFKNNGPINIEKLLNNINIENSENYKKDKIYNVADLVAATSKDLTFFHSKKYSSIATKTKASYCVTQDNLVNFLPNTCKKILVDNVLLTMAKITKEAIEAGALGALILGGTMAKAKLLSGQSKKNYYSKKKYADPRKVQRPDNFNF